MSTRTPCDVAVDAVGGNTVVHVSWKGVPFLYLLLLLRRKPMFHVHARCLLWRTAAVELVAVGLTTSSSHFFDDDQ